MDVLVFEFHVRMKDKRTKNNSTERLKGAMHSCTGGAFCCFTFLQKGGEMKKSIEPPFAVRSQFEVVVVTFELR